MPELVAESPRSRFLAAKASRNDNKEVLTKAGLTKELLTSQKFSPLAKRLFAPFTTQSDKIEEAPRAYMVSDSMPLRFLFASCQYMQFLDIEAAVPVPIDADELEPNRRYNVLLFLQNTGPVEYENVTVIASHETVEVESRGLSSLIIQSQPVDIPAQVNDAPGVVMVRFLFMSPSAGRGQLTAKVLPSGPSIVQPVQIRKNVVSVYASDDRRLSAEQD